MRGEKGREWGEVGQLEHLPRDSRGSKRPAGAGLLSASSLHCKRKDAASNPCSTPQERAIAGGTLSHAQKNWGLGSRHLCSAGGMLHWTGRKRRSSPTSSAFLPRTSPAALLLCAQMFRRGRLVAGRRGQTPRHARPAQPASSCTTTWVGVGCAV